MHGKYKNQTPDKHAGKFRILFTDSCGVFSGVTLLLLSLLLTACGFHLQGEKQLAQPLHRMYLQTPDPYGQLAHSLKQYLKISGVELVPAPTEAVAILNVMRDDTSQELVSVSGTQQTRQYNLKVSITFEITDAKGVTIIAPQTLTESRTITIQSNQVLGSSNEANLFYQQMRRNLAYSILNRLASREVSRTIYQAFYHQS
jgi:LPS-assembly lipoprotein